MFSQHKNNLLLNPVTHLLQQLEEVCLAVSDSWFILESCKI